MEICHTQLAASNRLHAKPNLHKMFVVDRLDSYIMIHTFTFASEKNNNLKHQSKILTWNHARSIDVAPALTRKQKSSLDNFGVCNRRLLVALNHNITEVPSSPGRLVGAVRVKRTTIQPAHTLTAGAPVRKGKNLTNLERSFKSIIVASGAREDREHGRSVGVAPERVVLFAERVCHVRESEYVLTLDHPGACDVGVFGAGELSVHAEGFQSVDVETGTVEVVVVPVSVVVASPGVADGGAVCKDGKGQRKFCELRPDVNILMFLESVQG